MNGFPMANWFCYGRFSLVGVGVGGENHTKMNINYPPRGLQLCAKACVIKNAC